MRRSRGPVSITSPTGAGAAGTTATPGGVTGATGAAGVAVAVAVVVGASSPLICQRASSIALTRKTVRTDATSAPMRKARRVTRTLWAASARRVHRRRWRTSDRAQRGASSRA